MTHEQFLVNLMKYIRIPYVWGSKNPNKALDCSGLVWNILLDLKIAPSYGLNAHGLFELFSPTSKPVIPLESNLGDLIFFGNEDHIHHVGMCLGDQKMIEAAHGNETVTSIEIAKENGAFVTVSSIYRMSDLFIILRPLNLPWEVSS